MLRNGFWLHPACQMTGDNAITTEIGIVAKIENSDIV